MFSIKNWSTDLEKGTLIYLYYFTTVLKHAWRDSTKEDVLQVELKISSWKSLEEYIMKNKLKGFKEEVGHTFLKFQTSAKIGNVKLNPTQPPFWL